MKAQLAKLTQTATVFGDGSCGGKYEAGTRGIAVECSYFRNHILFYPEKSAYYGGSFATPISTVELLSPEMEVEDPPPKPTWISCCEGSCFSGSFGAEAARAWVDKTMDILVSAYDDHCHQHGSAMDGRRS